MTSRDLVLSGKGGAPTGTPLMRGYDLAITEGGAVTLTKTACEPPSA